jgi:hypothetical protein
MGVQSAGEAGLSFLLELFA